jgi:pSer/pThr/pTyr-binding forkhead associated (FHA) protein
MAMIVVMFNRQEVSRHKLDRPKMVVGRDATCDIPIDNMGISRQHCAFVEKGGAFTVQDVGSSNGTYVNGKRVAEHFLNDGDEVMLGKYILKFVNEVQAAAPVPGQEAPVPGTLNTFVMDSGKIKEQLERMRSGAGGEPGQTGAPGSSAPGTKHTGAKSSDALQTYLLVSVVLNIVLLGVVAVLILALVSK